MRHDIRAKAILTPKISQNCSFREKSHEDRNIAAKIRHVSVLWACLSRHLGICPEPSDPPTIYLCLPVPKQVLNPILSTHLFSMDNSRGSMYKNPIGACRSKRI